jgi:hypothetical protein
MKVNLKKALLDLDGNVIPGSEMGSLVAQALVSGTDGDAVKLYELAMKVKNGEVDLDTSDSELLERCIKESKTLTVLAKGQILLELKKAK